MLEAYSNEIFIGVLSSIIATIIISQWDKIQALSSRSQDKTRLNDLLHSLENPPPKQPLKLLLLHLGFTIILFNILFAALYIYIDAQPDPSAAEQAALTVAYAIYTTSILLVSLYIGHRARVRLVSWTSRLTVICFLVLYTEYVIFSESFLTARGIIAFLGIICATIAFPVIVGLFAAEKTRQAFIIGAILRRLPPEDQAALIRFIKTLPSISKPQANTKPQNPGTKT